MEQSRHEAGLAACSREYASTAEALFMKRRQHGVNLDDGVALSTDDEFRLLFVENRPATRAALLGWLADNKQEAIIFGGQIGTGKTTLLNEILRSQLTLPIIRMHFDTDCIEASEGGYSMLMLGQILRACLTKNVNVEGCGLAQSDFAVLGCDDWAGIAETLSTPPRNLDIANRLRGVSHFLTPNSEQVRRACDELLDRLAAHLDRLPILVVDGIDKFDPTTADYFSMKDTLSFLALHKTLFEVNAVHLFQEEDFRVGLRKLFIGGTDDEFLLAVFAKRLGAYAPLYRQSFSLLTEYSGRNIRQGLRLLNAYYFQRTQRNNDDNAAMALACHRVGSDLLSLQFRQFPADVFSVVKRDGYIEGSLLKDRATAAGANEAVYRNWLFLDCEPTPAAPTKWPARINPLIDMAIDWKQPRPQTPEAQAVRKWARDHHVSPIGLNVPVDDRGEPDWDRFWKEIQSSGSSDEPLNLLQLLEEIGAGLFGLERRDRIIVAYKIRSNLEAVRDFLVGKANTYGFYPCEEISLLGGEGCQPIQELMTRLAIRDANRFYSIDLTGDWTDAQLRDLEHRRDLFDNLQMLWWIQQDALKRYLQFWQQLRQLFRIYRLEEEIWRGITTDEIEADIKVIEGLSSEKDPEGVRRLQSVLAFMKNQRGPA
jgi:hypothetical protein